MTSRVLLCILDGWGLPRQESVSAINDDTAPCFYDLLNAHGHASLQASGPGVGLPEGVQGNSEVGHLTIGAGAVRTSMHSLITRALEDKSFEALADWKEFVQTIQKRNKTVHIVTMLTGGFIHADKGHLQTVSKILHKNGIAIKLHAILDGRDSPPGMGHVYTQELLQNCPFVEIVTLSGREHCMDRSCDWNRTLKTYNAIIHGKNVGFDDLTTFFKDFNGEEFVEPCAKKGYKGFNYDQDTFLFLNFRADRMVQIVSALCDPHFTKPQTPKPLKQHWKSIAPYKRVQTIDFLLNHPPQTYTLGRYLFDQNVTQARISESEKSFHITYFFDGQQLLTGPTITHTHTPSFLDVTKNYEPNVPTNATAHNTILALQDPSVQFILVNFAACDLLGHTGNMRLTRQGVACVDRALSHIVSVAQENNVTVLVTADHGNADEMERNGKPHTGHSCNPVPFIIVSQKHKLSRVSGGLKDVAPSVLHVLSLEKPKNMQGHSLCV